MSKQTVYSLFLVFLLSLLPGTASCLASEALQLRESPFKVRTLSTEIDGNWIGNAIAYGPYRDGQSPGMSGPSQAQIREDLQLISRHWRLLRVYGSSRYARQLLEVIREERLPLQVMVGAWISPEFHGASASVRDDNGETPANQQEIATVIELTKEFPELVWAVSIGNECQVDWSDHKVSARLLAGYIRLVRYQTNVPVTTADDFRYWLDDASQSMAEEIDFLVMHAHPAWYGQEAENALGFVKEKYEAVRNAHPNRTIVIGETGWATDKNATGREKDQVLGKMGEAEQRQVTLELTGWARDNRITTFLFEAFDENWKGAPHPREVEKHWGLFRADRTPKPVMQVLTKQE